MSSLSQRGASAALEVPLEGKTYWVHQLRGREAISELYEFTIVLTLPPEQRLDVRGLLGRPLSLRLFPDWIVTEEAAAGDPSQPPRESGRRVHGICWDVRREPDPVGHRRRYVITLAPRIRALTLRLRSRIFQQKTAPEILEAALADVDVKPQLRRDYFPHNYCAQYQESDWAFLSRLMEEEGIFYRFEQGDSTERLILADTSLEAPTVSWPNSPESGTVGFDAIAIEEQHRRPCVSRVERVLQLRSTSFTHEDYAHEIANQAPSAVHSLPGDVTEGWPKHLEVRRPLAGAAHRLDSVGPQRQEQPEQLGWIDMLLGRAAEMEAERARADTDQLVGTANIPHFSAGSSFTLTDTPAEGEDDGRYLLTEVEHDLDGDVYQTQFRAIDAEWHFRPPKKTPIPRMNGPHSARVVGPEGEEIHTDKYGRIKVTFPWSLPEDGEQTSCWMRVSQSWAGGQWGMLALPRVGQEVIVDFHDGDPDQPFVAGSVYNSSQPAPASLPEERTRFMIKSKTHQGTDFHGLMFDDQSSQPAVQVRSDGTYHLQAKDNAGHDYGGKFVETHRDARVSLVGGLPFIHPPSNALISDSGSGAGSGGDSSTYQKIQVSDVPKENWAFNSWSDLKTTATHPTVRTQLTTGAALDGVLGLSQDVTVGNFSRMTIDPTLSFLLTPFAAAAPFASLAGSTYTTLGHENFLHYGTRYTCHGGPTFNYYNRTLLNPFMAIYAIINGLQFFLTMGNPNYTGLTAAAISELVKEVMILIMRLTAQATYAYDATLSLLGCIKSGATNAGNGNFQTAMSYFGQAGSQLENSTELLLDFGLSNGNSQALRVTGASHSINLGQTDTYTVRKLNTQQTLVVEDGYSMIGTEEATLTLGNPSAIPQSITGAELTTTAEGEIRINKDSYGDYGHTLLMAKNQFDLTSKNTGIANSGTFFNLNATAAGTTMVASKVLTLQSRNKCLPIPPTCVVSLNNGTLTLTGTAINIESLGTLTISAAEEISFDAPIVSGLEAANLAAAGQVIASSIEQAGNEEIDDLATEAAGIASIISEMAWL
ncbi:Phage-related baseplate assembly protein [Planctomycetes bacterium Pan216]|uniref:Phage-related baseplate assembly protein n=1 Tax=Kolteria novifilia TaxID=2527975 RepID=A0A518B8K0_9BACT|nr:Phage-related baseplate assembly protein [Planctomycetes bacterium Pan216]